MLGSYEKMMLSMSSSATREAIALYRKKRWVLKEVNYDNGTTWFYLKSMAGKVVNLSECDFPDEEEE